MAETKRTNTQYVFPVNARFAQGFAWVARGPTLAPERVGSQTLPLRHLPSRKCSPDPGPAGFSRCFQGLWAQPFPPVTRSFDPKAFSQGQYSPRL